MEKDTFLINKKYVLEKFSGKGGWTYISIPEISPSKNTPFGWVTVSGFIDDYQLMKVKLLPMGNNRLFLPVKSAIRKKIKKQETDTVQLKLNIDNLPIELSQEIIDCFENEPKKVYENFLGLPNSKQKYYLDWIYQSKTEQTKAERILEVIQQLSKN